MPARKVLQFESRACGPLRDADLPMPAGAMRWSGHGPHGTPPEGVPMGRSHGVRRMNRLERSTNLMARFHCIP